MAAVSILNMEGYLLLLIKVMANTSNSIYHVSRKVVVSTFQSLAFILPAHDIKKKIRILAHMNVLQSHNILQSHNDIKVRCCI